MSKTKDFPFGDRTPIRLAMLGMVEGNGHPYSWSAIINSYNKEEMAKNPYAGITRYLNAQPFESVRVPGVQVTHIWTDDPKACDGDECGDEKSEKGLPELASGDEQAEIDERKELHRSCNPKARGSGVTLSAKEEPDAGHQE